MANRSRRRHPHDHKATGPRGIPDWHEVCAAFRGALGYTPGDHLITRWAQSLAHLHRTRHINPARATEIDRRRSDLVTLINQWVCTHIEPAHGRAELVGPTVDALASAYVEAELLLLIHTEVAEEAMHAAWSTVGYLATQWTDLVAEVIDGQPCPPGRC
ncbi:DUF4254 domain-containing protein [Nocardia amamiensis]|uniref:DUF4254 domain-containing protein n=1 Tax=Nocardia amamiensis TaxID=404578 RepID=A0ABS0CNK9_9NOCA|nr:DUF4254 domain-containing protein [Nocardia amamiensis]MBF6298238.1 DUF4254 domain-containing protein [Nocardia amamiensis]